MINTHLLRVVLLNQGQQTYYELCNTWVNILDMNDQSLEEKCDILQKKLDIVEGEKIRYKNMCKNVENYINIEASLLANIRRFSKDLM